MGSHRMVLFVQNRDPKQEIWTGERYGVDRAMEVFGADDAYPIEEFEAKVADCLSGVDKVFYRVGQHESWDRMMFRVLEQHRKRHGRTGYSLAPILDPQSVLGEMRLRKEPEEIEMLARAAEITAQAHLMAMKETRPGMFEYEVAAIFDGAVRQHGCQRVGYESIAAGGANATCLHYTRNNKKLLEGELLLIDAGGEYEFYTADITRTYPVGKSWSREQGKIYDLVLKAQAEVLKSVRPGSSMEQLQEKTCEVLTEGLLSLGLLKGDAGQIIQTKKYERFYPHRLGHYLGMDVHDVGLYRQGEKPILLEPGMVFTVEPGLYCQPDDKECPEAYRGIGIRIEDNVVVTQDGYENLTKNAPKERTELTKIRSEAMGKRKKSK